MAFEFGQFNEFSDQVTKSSPTVMAVAKAIRLGPFIGRFYQAMIAPLVTIKAKEFKVFSRSFTARDGVIGNGAGNGWDAAAVTGLKMTAAVLKGLTVGLVLQVGDEVVIIKEVDRAANTISVWARGAGGTTPAAHADQVAFKVTGSAGDDTDLKNVESMNETTSDYENYVQTVFEAMDWTKHGTLVRQGMDSATATSILVEEAEIRVARNLSRMAILGRKQAAVNGSNRSMSAGLFAQLNDTNGGKRNIFKYNANGILTEDKVKAALKEIFSAGGNPNTLWVSPTVKEYVNAFNIANSSLVISTGKDDHSAGTYITNINYEGAIINVEIDADIPDDQMAVTNQAKCQKGWLEGDGLTMKDEPTQSSREMRKSLQGSVGFLIEDVGSEHGIIYGITGGSTDRVSKVSIINPTTNPVNTKEVA